MTRMAFRLTPWLWLASVTAGLVHHLVIAPLTSYGAPLEVAGSPGYNSATGNGFQNGAVYYPGAGGVNNSGTAMGYSEKYVSGNDVGNRGVRWDASGTAATELGNLGTFGTGVAYARANTVNDAGTAVGWSQKYVSGADRGSRAVRWDASGTAATELGNLGTDSSGFVAGFENRA